MADSVNPIVAAWQIRRAMRTTRHPQPGGEGTMDHSALALILAAVRDGGIDSLVGETRPLEPYTRPLESIDPASLTPAHALAYWINLYNAHAIELARYAARRDMSTVLDVDGAFDGTVTSIAGETLSMNAIEHGKIRRFGNPLIHGALVCGSVSCPTLRGEPFTGEGIGAELDDQMRWFLANGGAVVVGDTLHLSRVFGWYSGDFVRGAPSWLPARKSRVVAALADWLPEEAATAARVEYMAYDWGLGCAVL